MARIARAAAMSLLIAVAALAAPQRIHYQGFLLAPDSTPLDTTIAITFKVYDGPDEGANLVWTETQPAIHVQAGLFSAVLGTVAPLEQSAFATDNRWLGITVGGDAEMTPRQQIVSVAWSYRVGTVDGASGGTVSGDLIVTSKACIGPGNLNPGTSAFAAGSSNMALGNFSTVGGGSQNLADSEYSTVGGGLRDSVLAWGATIAGGWENTATGVGTAIGGGYFNHATSNNATIAGGYSNEAVGYNAAIAGGIDNYAHGSASAIGGGSDNTAYHFATVVAGGVDNYAGGLYSTVGGGANNPARGQNSVVAGRRIPEPCGFILRGDRRRSEQCR